MISTQVYATFTVGQWACYAAPDGRTPVLIGCRHDTPKEACAHVENTEPYTSPLRADGTGTPVADPSPEAVAVPIPAAPRGDRPAKGMRR